MKNLFNRIKEDWNDFKENWDDIKSIGKHVVIPILALGVLAFLPFRKVVSLYQTRPKNTTKIEKSFDEKVTDAMKDESNIMNFNGTGFYVDINKDKIPDAYVFPAPVRYGCVDAIRLR